MKNLVKKGKSHRENPLLSLEFILFSPKEVKTIKENREFIRGVKGASKYYKRNTSGVYIIKHDNSGQFYIGASKDVNRRLSHHFGQLKRSTHHCQRLQILYGKSNHEDFSYFVYEEKCENLKSKELSLLESHKDNSLLLNTSIERNSWVATERNAREIAVWKEKISNHAKTRTGELNPFYGKTHTKETLDKIQQSRYGFKNKSCWKAIVINGVKYDSVTEAAKQLGLNVSTVSNRANSDNLLFINWYFCENGEIVEVKDHRLIFDVNNPPKGLFEVEGEIYYSVEPISEKYEISISGVYHRFKNDKFPGWVKLI